MTSYPILREPELTEEAIKVLMRELGPVNALRFIARVSPAADSKDSVQLHREYAARVENDDELRERMLRLLGKSGGRGAAARDQSS